MINMSNSSASNKTAISTSSLVGYYPLFLVIGGTILNSLTFIVLSRMISLSRRRQETIHYMRIIAIFDILMLYGWNLDHYIAHSYGFLLQHYSIVLCKLLSFLNYFAAQSSAWLRVLMCYNRYLALSRLHQTWFNHSNRVLVTILSIIVFFFLFNSHILLFACFYKANGKINVNARAYRIYPQWDYVNLVVYNCLPFIFMVIFNSGVINHLIRLRQSTTISNSRIQHRAISITLVLTTFLFLLMTIPATVSFAFFYSATHVTVLHQLDSVLYTYHILSFPLYFLTFSEFRQACMDIILTPNKRRSSLIYARTLPFMMSGS